MKCMDFLIMWMIFYRKYTIWLKKWIFDQMNKHKKRSKLNCNFEHQKDIFKKIRFAVIKNITYKIIENKFH